MSDEILVSDNLTEKLENIFKHFVLIFGEKVNTSFESINTKKIKNEKDFLIECCKYLDEEIELNFYLHSKSFSDFTKVFPITKEQFVLIYKKSCEQKREEFLTSPAMKKLVSETLSELPNCLARVYNINMGMETKADGTEVTLKEYSTLTNEDHQINLELLESAKNLLELKIKRKLGRKKI